MIRYLPLFLLAGCTGLTTKVDRVEVPVVTTQACVAAADVPVIPRTAAVAGGSMTQDAAAASRDARVYRTLAEQQNAMLKLCSEQP